MWFLGGMTIVAAGWLGPRAVYLDFVSQYTADWLWQLYANRRMIGTTVRPGERRIVGQLIPIDSPAPLTLVRVPVAERLVDHGADLPVQPWNQYRLEWEAESYPPDTSHFDLTGSLVVDGPVNDANVIARIPFRGDAEYGFDLPPLAQAGDWSFRITPRDNAKPLGNAGTASDVTITARIPPRDVVASSGQRFTLAAASGTLTADFVYG